MIVNSENKKIGCVAPEGNWKEFVILNFADLMLEENKEQKEDEPKQI